MLCPTIEHYSFIHLCLFLHCIERTSRILWLTFENNSKRKLMTRSCHGDIHCCSLHIACGRLHVDCFKSSQLKCCLVFHGEEDWSLIHVEKISEKIHLVINNNLYNFSFKQLCLTYQDHVCLMTLTNLSGHLQ